MKLSDLAKKMIVSISIIALICILGSVIYYRSLYFLPFMWGVFLGSFVSIIKVFLLDHAVDKAVKMEQKHAGNYMSIQHMLRLLLSGIVLVLGALVPQISLWGVAAGILAFQLAAYSLKFTPKR
ncbi:hypothetical protein GCM10023142_02780 [Anaerocolumna aminovalerica]|uniref:ATP synthase I chain n=1 Tax=Anaerocolumna aminovalerica TaxID=1527 RepID=A0A1I5BPP7_9FIRM|nr:ATP synthase subunit I [Anaerocolumna aminovalerica]SFN76692.1 ATP synthase I chain [Anaerocolumna aminovalerica]